MNQDPNLAGSFALEAMLAAGRDPMTLIDRELRYCEANRAYLAARGLSREEVVGRSVADLWGDSILDTVAGDALRRAFGGEPVRYRAIFELARGSERFLEVQFDPVAAGGGMVSHVVVTTRDLSIEREMAADLESARSEAQALRQALATTFGRLASVLGERVGRLLGALDVAGAEAQDGERRIPLRDARFLAAGLLSAVDDAIAAEGAEAGARREQVPFHLASLVDEIGLAAGRLAAQRGLLVLLDIAPGLPDHFRGNRLLLREALREMLELAIEKTESGRVVMRALSADSGDGPPGPAIDVLFETQAGEGKGGGLGRFEDRLREASVRLGGSLEIAAGGRLLRLRIPLSPAALAVPSPRGCIAPRILVVDDMPVNLEVVRDQLARRRLRVDIARGGAEALARLAAGGLDLVFLDWKMPDMDGLAVARAQRLHEAEAGLDRVPLVAVTASAVAGDRERCLEAGMDDYITKPLRPADLDRVLARWLPSGLGSAAPALDPQVLANLDDPEDPAFLVELTEIFLADSPPRLDALCDAQRVGEWELAKRAAHALRGSAVNLGALPLAELCRRVEEAAPAGEGDLAAMVDAIEREYARAAATLRIAAAGR